MKKFFFQICYELLYVILKNVTYNISSSTEHLHDVSRESNYTKIEPKMITNVCALSHVWEVCRV